MKTRLPADGEPLIRQFTVLGLWLLIVNGMIGAGIFGVPAEAARLTGDFSPLMFLVCGLLMLPVMLSFGEVASYFRGTGGPILYASTAYGPIVGFQTGWAFYVARATAFGANINLVVSSLAYFWPAAETRLPRMLLFLLICALLTYVNVIGAKQAMRSLGVLTILKFVPLLLLVLVGTPALSGWSGGAAVAPLPAYTELGTASLVLIYAFVGFESGLVPAGEARQPARDMPRALLWALGIVTVLYVFVQAVSITVLPDLAASERPLVDVAAALLGPVGAFVLMAGVIASVGGNIAGSMISTPRISYQLSREGSLPAWFGAVHPRYATPSRSVIFYGVVVFLLSVVGSFAWLAAMSALTRILIYLVCIAAIPRLRRLFPDAPHRWHLPGGYAIPLLAIVVCFWLLSQVNWNGVLATASFLAVGGVLYLFARRGSATPG